MPRQRSLVALAFAAGYSGTLEDLGRACVAFEGASDPLMFPHPDRLVWASRQGSIVATHPPLPRAHIVGGQWREPCKTDPQDDSFQDVSDLIEAWGKGTQLGDFAEIASQSASRCNRAKGQTDPMADLMTELGALGYVRAHSGSARGLIFAPGSVPQRWRLALREAGLKGLIGFETGGAE